MRKLIVLALATLAFAACKKKNKEEDRPEKQKAFSIEGVWEEDLPNAVVKVAFMFNLHNNTYKKYSYDLAIEEGPLQTRVFNNTDSVEVKLKNETILIVKQGNNNKVSIKAGDSTRVFNRVLFL